MVSVRGAVYSNAASGTIISLACCPQPLHEALKADPVLWAAAPFVGVQHFEDGRLELRNCAACASTLAVELPPDETPEATCLRCGFPMTTCNCRRRP